MSDTMGPVDGPDDEQLQRFEEEARLVYERFEAAAESVSKIGLYAEHAQIVPVPTPFGTKPGVAVTFSIGKVAFSDRIQDPEKDRIDDQIRQSEVAISQDNFLDVRERMRRNVEAGRDPLDDGDEDPDFGVADISDLDFSLLGQFDNGSEDGSS